MQDDPKNWVDRLLWGLICLAAFYATDQIKSMNEGVQDELKKMSANVHELNKNVAVAIQSLSALKESREDHEKRIRNLERKLK